MTGRILAAGFAAALVVFAWRAGATFRGLVTAGMSDKTVTASDPHLGIPGTLTLNLASGGSLTCRLAGAAYTCTPAPVRNAVRGAQP
jgi:hypothetical protein